MNYEQLQQAQNKSKELLDYHHKTERLRTFIEILEEDKYIKVTTTHQKQLWENKECEMYDLFGSELVEILKKKLWEREDYLEKLDADDLVITPTKESEKE